jgi:hypothetical protein
MTFTAVRRFAQARWREFRIMRKALAASPPAVRLLIGSVLVLLIWASGNWTYHAINKPTEILFPLDQSLVKSPPETWRQYGSLFRKHSTPIITPDLLAALAQIEGGGNPMARTYWRWRQTWNPLELYRPASSAVGMYQITDSTFREAKRYCIRNHTVVEDGPWNDVNSCWFNSLYTRVAPSHAIELTSAQLDRAVTSAIGQRKMASVTLQRKQDLAAVIHLCGAGAGKVYARNSFRLMPRQRCGDHDVNRYLARVNGMKRQFARMASAG